MKIHLSPLIIPLVAAAVFTHTAPMLLTAYISVTLHEAAHLIAALVLGLMPESLDLSPFGAHLALKNKIVRCAADEIILYLAGPLMSGALALLGIYFKKTEFFRINSAIMLMNMLPVIPLDGGVIFKRILLYRLSLRDSERILKIISVTLGTAFFALALYSIYRGNINPSAFIMSLFLIGNAITGRELYNTELINGLYSKKRTNRARLVVAGEGSTMLDAAKAISPAYTTFAAIQASDGSVKLIGEREIIERLSDKII